MLSIANRNTIDSKRGGASAFSIEHSFYFDAIDNQFTYSGSDFTYLKGFLSGNQKKFTSRVVVKRDSIGSTQAFFSSSGSELFLRFDANNTIKLGTKDGGVFKFATWSNTYTSLTQWLVIDLVMDGTLTLGNRAELYVNNVLQTKTADAVTADIDTLTGAVGIGTRGGGDMLKGYINQLSFLDVIETPTQRTNFYNGGKPLDSQAQMGVNCIGQFNPDNSGSTAQFTVNDPVNNIDAVSTNLVDGNKTTTTPY